MAGDALMQPGKPTDPDATPYAREPLGVVDGIPVFSPQDTYTRNYERISADHLAHESEKGENPFIVGVLWEELEASTISLVKKYARAGDRILDAGVGLGRLLAHVPGLRRYGTDISIGYLNGLRKSGIEICLARLEDLPYRESFFDVVVCTDVLEHVLDLNLVVTRLLSVLKPGGTLVVRVPYRENLAPYTAPDYPYEYAHLRAFDEHSLALLFSKIFHVQVLEWSVAGWWPIASRLKNTHSRVIRRLVCELGALLIRSRKLRSSRLSRLFFLPMDVNFVLRKPTSCAG